MTAAPPKKKSEEATTVSAIGAAYEQSPLEQKMKEHPDS